MRLSLIQRGLLHVVQITILLRDSSHRHVNYTLFNKNAIARLRMFIVLLPIPTSQLEQLSQISVA